MPHTATSKSNTTVPKAADQITNAEFGTGQVIYDEFPNPARKPEDPVAYFPASYIPGNHPFTEYVDAAAEAQKGRLIDGPDGDKKGLFERAPLDMDKFKSFNKEIQNAMFTKDFDAWIEENFLNIDGPQAGYAKEWIRKVYPEYFNRRERQYEADRQLEDRLAKLNMFGITDFESLMTQFMLDRGLIDYERLNYPLWNPRGHLNTINKYVADGFVVRGLYSPKRFTGMGVTPQYKDPNRRMPFHFASDLGSKQPDTAATFSNTGNLKPNIKGPQWRDTAGANFARARISNSANNPFANSGNRPHQQ